MQVDRAIRYRVHPNQEQTALFRKTIGCCRKLYNTLLAWKREDDKLYNESRGQHQREKMPLVTWVKEQCPYMAEVDSLALMNARRNIENAYDNYITSLMGKRKGKRVGQPKFKKKDVTKSSYSTNMVNHNIAVGYKFIKLPKVGKVEAVIHRRLPSDAVIQKVTVTQERNGDWYVSVAYRCDIRPKARCNEVKSVVGLDMSMASFLVSSDESEDVAKAKYVRQYRKSEKKRSRLNRKMSRRKKGSHRREKARLLLANHDRHTANRRKDFCHKMSRYYARNYDAIVIEDLNMQAMSRTLHLGKSVMDLGFGMFRSMLTYKCVEEGSELVIADKWFASSKICNECGEKYSELKLSDREWVCPHCGCLIDRDLNAARNLRDYYYREIECTAGTVGIDACGDATSTSGETLVQVVSLKLEEAPKSLV